MKIRSVGVITLFLSLTLAVAAQESVEGGLVPLKQITLDNTVLSLAGPSGSPNAPAVLQVLGGTGAPNFNAGKGGNGGGMGFSAGKGGDAACGGSQCGETGGTGGSLVFTAGNGGIANGESGLHGGNGGSITLQPGTGGVATFSGTNGSVILAPKGGNVGIGGTAPANTLEIAGGGTTLADAWTVRSSRRFKLNIQPLAGSLAKIQQLQGVSYDRKIDGKHEIGVVAEDVDQVVPEVVSRDPVTHEIQGVDYARLAALLIEAVKSQQAEIDQLKVQIQQLTAK